MAWDLGQIASTSAPVVWSIGHVREPAVQYVQADGTTQNRSLLFWTQFSNITEAVRFHLVYMRTYRYIDFGTDISFPWRLLECCRPRERTGRSH